jgi:hypothetical protein
MLIVGDRLKSAAVGCQSDIAVNEKLFRAEQLRVGRPAPDASSKRNTLRSGLAAFPIPHGADRGN